MNTQRFTDSEKAYQFLKRKYNILNMIITKEGLVAEFTPDEERNWLEQSHYEVREIKPFTKNFKRFLREELECMNEMLHLSKVIAGATGIEENYLIEFNTKSPFIQGERK